VPPWSNRIAFIFHILQHLRKNSHNFYDGGADDESNPCVGGVLTYWHYSGRAERRLALARGFFTLGGKYATI